MVLDTKRGRAQLQAKATENYSVSVHVWAAIGYGFRELVIFPEHRRRVPADSDDDDNKKKFFRVNGMEYRRRCVKEKLSDHMAGSDLTLIQDGARAHTAKPTKKLLNDRGIKFFDPWPARSPDLNPIEHLWSWLKRCVAAKRPTTREELVAAIRAVWNHELTDDMVQKHLRSWNSGLARCIKERGM